MNDTNQPDSPRDKPESRLQALRKDLVAGLVDAVVSIPDGLASAALAGVNPVYGLYTSIAAPIGGSLLASAQLMHVATTSASALAAGQAISSYPQDERDNALFLLVVLTGITLALFGLLGFGRLVRFVSYAVMTGFLIGVAVVLILDQAAPLVGYEPEGANEVSQFGNLLQHFSDFSGQTVLVGIVALVIAFGLDRTRFSQISSIAALVVPTALVALVGFDQVQLVNDVNPIPRGIPTPALPDLSLLTPQLVGAALSVAVVIAVQGAGVSESVENPDGSPIDPSRDLIAQGVANAASGLASGIPAGGSVGQTALNVSSGARSRWAGVFSGLWILAFILLVPDLVGQVPMTVLAALMIVAGFSAISTNEARSIWDTSNTSRGLIVVTLIATLLLSVPVAVGVGVALAILLYLGSAASDVNVLAVVQTENGEFIETEPPEKLPSNAVTVLDVYGSLFFAGAQTLEERLPSPRDATRPVVVLRLRGRTSVGATLIDTLDQYADDLEEVGGKLYLTGVHEDVATQLRRAGKLDLDKTVVVVPVDDVVGRSTQTAVTEANIWLTTAARTAQSDGEDQAG